MASNAITVVRQKLVQASWEECWRSLTTPEVVSEWFAQTSSIAEQLPVVFDFGDGDFFAGTIDSVEAPANLRLRWRFWNVGPEYSIWFALSPAGSQIELSVIDCGSESVVEAESLREGWDDFLMRFEKRVTSGEPCRYRWTESIGATCYAPDSDALWTGLHAPAYWRALFPLAEVDCRVEPQGDVRLEIRDSSWPAALVTHAHVRKVTHRGLSCLRITHTGFTQLPEPSQVDARRNYARIWCGLLESIESRFAGLAAA